MREIAHRLRVYGIHIWACCDGRKRGTRCALTCTRAQSRVTIWRSMASRSASIAMPPREGGTVAFDARAQLHPRTEAVTAKLAALLKHEVPATLDASEAADESEAGE
ncbi:hypothetical protein OKW40_001974 [Paraburkholderia sp. RAU6.4a]